MKWQVNQQPREEIQCPSLYSHVDRLSSKSCIIFVHKVDRNYVQGIFLTGDFAGQLKSWHPDEFLKSFEYFNGEVKLSN